MPRRQPRPRDGHAKIDQHRQHQRSGDQVKHQDQVTRGQPAVEHGIACRRERERCAERHQATRRCSRGGGIQVEARPRQLAGMCQVCHAISLSGEVSPWLQAPRRLTSSANPSTTMSVAGLGIGSGGPAGPTHRSAAQRRCDSRRHAPHRGQNCGTPPSGCRAARGRAP